VDASIPAAGKDDYVAARLLLNLAYVTRHDSARTVADKTGIDPARITEILTGHGYPDGYEIATIERAYHQRIWPREHE
jgi:hypothetical protein